MTISRIRRVVTGHGADGKAIVLMDAHAPNAKVRAAAGGLVSTLVWVTDETPADISGAADRSDRTIGVPPPPNGTVFRIVDFPPVTDASTLDNAAILKEMGIKGGPSHGSTGGSVNPFMHRTRSVDYAIVMSGEIDMEMDDSVIHLRAGDVLVQQGTNHAWINRSTETCRIAFVLIDAAAPPQWGGATG